MNKNKSLLGSLKYKEANVWITTLTVLTVVVTAGLLLMLGDRLQYKESLANLWDGRPACGSEGCATGYAVGGNIKYGASGGPKASANIESINDEDGTPADWPGQNNKSANTTPSCTTKPICADKTTLTKTQTTILRWSCPSGNTKAKIVNSSGTTIATSLKSTTTIGPFSNTVSGSTKTYKIYCYTTTQGNPDGQVGIKIN